MMTWISAVLAVIAFAGLAASAIGWRHSLLRWNGDAEWYFAAAKVLYAIAIGTRIVFWDTIWTIWARFDPVTAVEFSRSSSMVHINVVTTAIVILGAYASLKARELLIPEPLRSEWPWWRAWRHPKLRWRVRFR